MFFPIRQALAYVGGSSRVELPRVVERETVKEDGAVVKRCVRDAQRWRDCNIKIKKSFH